MTSLQTSLKQVGLNNGYFRVIPALMSSFGVAGAIYEVSSYMYTLSNGALGAFTPQNLGAQRALSSGQAILRDMGVNFISSNSAGTAQPQIFRRVQIVDGVSGGIGNGGVSGTSTGSDSDYDCAYIAMGFNGIVPAPGYGPFIRTG